MTRLLFFGFSLLSLSLFASEVAGVGDPTFIEAKNHFILSSYEALGQVMGLSPHDYTFSAKERELIQESVRETQKVYPMAGDDLQINLDAISTPNGIALNAKRWMSLAKKDRKNGSLLPAAALHMHLLSCGIADETYDKTISIQKYAKALSGEAVIGEDENDLKKLEPFRAQIQFQFIATGYEALGMLVSSADQNIAKYLEPHADKLHEQLEKLSAEIVSVRTFDDREPKMIIRGTTTSDTLIDYKLWKKLSDRDRKAAVIHHLLILAKVNQTQPSENRQVLQRLFAK